MLLFNPALDPMEVAAALPGRFLALASLSTGGQAQVFKANPAGAPGLSVALKVYFPDQLEERTAREIDALRGLSGDTLVKLYESGTCVLRGRKCIYVATGFVEGESLE